MVGRKKSDLSVGELYLHKPKRRKGLREERICTFVLIVQIFGLLLVLVLELELELELLLYFTLGASENSIVSSRIAGRKVRAGPTTGLILRGACSRKSRAMIKNGGGQCANWS